MSKKKRPQLLVYAKNVETLYTKVVDFVGFLWFNRNIEKISLSSRIESKIILDNLLVRFFVNLKLK